MQTVDFNSARVTNRRPTRISDGLMVTGELQGKHLHQAFGMDNLANLNIGYAQIFAATDQYHGKPMIGMTEAKGKLKLINSHGFRWELSGGASQKARITKVVNVDTYPGLNHQHVDVVVDKPWWNISDIIQPQDQEYRLRVTTKDGSRKYRKLGPNQYQYTLELIGRDPKRYIPRHFLQLGAEWCKVSSAVADEANQDFGGFQFFNIFQSEGYVQQHSIKVELSDKAARKAKAYADSDKFEDAAKDLGRDANAIRHLWTSVGENKTTGKPIMRFMSLLDAEAFNELYRNTENTLMFGQESHHMYSPEGHQIHTASGLREQLKSGWNLEHSGNLSMSELEDWLDSILKDKISEGDQKIVFSAGRAFRQMFDRAVKADSSTFLTLDTHFIRSGEDFRHLDYGSYFATYRGFSVDITVMENPAYDNPMYSPKRHPVRTNMTVDSYRADILDFGYSKQQGTGLTTDNISMIAQDHCDYHISYNGKWRAFDGKSGLPITDGGLGQAGNVSGYSIIREKSAGLMVADPTRMGSVTLAIDDDVNTVAAPSAEDYWNW